MLRASTGLRGFRIRTEAASPGSLGGTGSRSDSAPGKSSTSTTDALASGQEDFCIIESRESLKDFAKLQLTEINQAIKARRNRMFLLLEEVRRLRVQQRLKGGEKSKEEELLDDTYPSVIPLLPPMTDKTISMYLRIYLSALAFIIVFGGLLAPTLEVRLGLGGTSYSEFIRSAHLPAQLADVDPIVASFCGGAVGVLSTLMLVESNNSKVQAANRCIYCGGTGYCACGTCGGVGAMAQQAVSASGADSSSASASQSAVQERCASCSGTGKVMCTACLCTGKKVAREHDPRLDPFS
ncbi:hypothetical protein WJX73_004208 [Symbiochloris irregularis]|uniref:Uncharacterized protein n=1 Tax=Symbiochloris irregularis TaxID=706552 RepID=A0AAW1PI31_9CHLO